MQCCSVVESTDAAISWGTPEGGTTLKKSNTKITLHDLS